MDNPLNEKFAFCEAQLEALITMCPHHSRGFVYFISTIHLFFICVINLFFSPFCFSLSTMKSWEGVPSKLCKI